MNSAKLSLRSIAAMALAAVALLFTAACRADPPGRVGRLSLIEGTVSLRNADSGEWQAAWLNWPITGNDVLWGGPGARAEIRVGSTVIRLDGGTELQVVELDDQALRLRLLRGSLSLRLANPRQADQFELATNQGHTALIQVGRYRFDVGDDVSAVTVYDGGLRFEDDERAYDVRPGQMGEFSWAGTLGMYLAEPRRDGFYDWIAFRDGREDRIRDPRWISPEMTGAQDLGDYGDWQDGGDYGPVWFPRLLPVGWSPYRMGRWAYVGPWGWTWIDDTPWGFAPFHYGRWVYWRSRWGWVPGAYVAAPVYAPALVAWVGPPGTQQALPGGGVGWFPLAPREPYHPSYRVSITYARSINVGQVVNVNAIDINRPWSGRFANRQLPQAVSVVAAAAMAAGRPVAGALLKDVDVHALAASPVSQVAPQAPQWHRDGDHRHHEPDAPPQPPVGTATPAPRPDGARTPAVAPAAPPLVPHAAPAPAPVAPAVVTPPAAVAPPSTATPRAAAPPPLPQAAPGAAAAEPRGPRTRPQPVEAAPPAADAVPGERGRAAFRPSDAPRPAPGSEPAETPRGDSARIRPHAAEGVARPSGDGGDHGRGAPLAAPHAQPEAPRATDRGERTDRAVQANGAAPANQASPADQGEQRRERDGRQRQETVPEATAASPANQPGQADPSDRRREHPRPPP